MKSKIQFTVLIVLMVLGPLAQGQQIPSFNLYHNQRFLLNPAFAGENEFLQGFLDSKRQWVGVPGAPVTSVFGLHQAWNDKVGLGIQISSDKAALLERLSGNLNYSYKIRLSNTRNHHFTMGLSLGFVDNKLLMNEAIGDPNDPLVLEGNNDGITIDAAFGARYQLEDFEFSFAVPQILNSPIGYQRLNGEDLTFELKSHFIAMASYRFHFLESSVDANGAVSKSGKERFSIEPSVMFRAVPIVPAQLDVNLVFRNPRNQWLGLTYRPTNSGIVISGGLPLLEGLHVGYGYEINNSKLAEYSSGTHEFTLVYNFFRKKESGKADTKKEDLLTKEMVDKMLNRQKMEMKNQFDSLDYVMSGKKSSLEADAQNQQLRAQIEQLQAELAALKAQGSGTGGTVPAVSSGGNDASTLALQNQVTMLQAEINKLKSQGTVSQPAPGNEGLEALKKELEELRRYVKTIKGGDLVELKTVRDGNDNEVLVEENYKDGCYVVIHSVKNVENAKRAVRIEKDRGNEASIIYNKGTGWYHVYLYYDSELQPALLKMREVRKSIQPEAWVHIYRH